MGEVRAAMAAVGIDGATQAGFVLPMLAAVLHLGNISFEALSDDASAVAADATEALAAAADLLGLEQRALQAALTTRRLAAGGETVVATLSAAAAAANRDALAKGLYASLFGWLVDRVSEQRAGGPGERGGQGWAGRAAAAAAASCGWPSTVSAGSAAASHDAPSPFLLSDERQPGGAGRHGSGRRLHLHPGCEA